MQRQSVQTELGIKREGQRKDAGEGASGAGGSDARYWGQKKREALCLPLVLKNVIEPYLLPSPLAGEGLGMRGINPNSAQSPGWRSAHPDPGWRWRPFHRD